MPRAYTLSFYRSLLCARVWFTTHYGWFKVLLENIFSDNLLLGYSLFGIWVYYDILFHGQIIKYKR